MHTKRWVKRVVVGFGLSAAAGYCGAWLLATPYQRPADVPFAETTVTSDPTPEVLVPGASSLPPAEAPLEPLVAQKARTPSLKNTRNILVVGLDRRPDGSGPSLTDTLVVVVLDERSQHVGLISIPRDLYVDIPQEDASFAKDRINTVYSAARHGKRDPIELLKRVVEDTLELPIQHAIALDLGVFERAVDAVGGVTVDVPCALADNFIDSRVDGGRRALDVDEGSQHMDGVTAAMYARSRHGRSDFHRARRQQAILMGVQRALTGFGITKFPELFGELESSVETDMRRIELLSLGRRALSIDPAHLHGFVIGDQQVRGVMTADGKAVLEPDFEAIDTELGKLFSAPSPGVGPKVPCVAKDAALRGTHAMR
jgi:LCP family protein required for cell wall assembly